MSLTGFQIKKIVGQDDKKKSILEINQKEAEIVKMIYDMYIKKGSVRKIVETLNLNSIKPRNDRLWSTNQVSRILTRPVYTSNSLDVYNYYFNTGIIIINDVEAFDGTKSLTIVGKEKGKGKYRKNIDIEEQYLVIFENTPIIDSQLWLQVQNKKQGNKQIVPNKFKSKVCFLSGLLYCSYCKYGMSIKSQSKNTKSGLKHYSYICCNTKKNRGYKVCPSKLHLVSDIENMVVAHLINHIAKNKIYNKINTLKNNVKIDITLINSKNLLQAKINKSNTEISNLIKSISEGNSVANNYIQKTIESIDSKIQDYKVELNKIEAEIYNTSNNYDTLLEVKEFLKNPKQISDCSFDTKRKICKAMIKRINIADNEIDIEYLY